MPTRGGRSPTQLGETVRTLVSESSSEDGRVQSGATLHGTRGQGAGRFYLNVTGFPFPLGPLFARQTVRYEVVPGSIWTFEQEQSLAGINVSTTVRMTVVKLKSGGLWIHAPIAPTRECVELLEALGAPVEHIVLTTHAYEHKIFVPPFQRRYGAAQVWVVPRQWSWPVDLHLPLLGIFRARILAMSSKSGQDVPWADEIEFENFSESIGIAPYSEGAFYHKASKTLMVTDAVVYLPEKPPEVINRAKLLRAGKDNAFVRLVYGKEPANIPATEEEQEIIGWHRMALLVLYFAPEKLRVPSNFDAVSERLLVSPVIQALVFSKVPGPSRAWVDRITERFPFERVVSGHFASPIPASPKDFRVAFEFAYAMRELPQSEEEARALPQPRFQSWFGRLPALPEQAKRGLREADLGALQTLDALLRATGGVFRYPNNRE
ncbi:hypothetical protein WJX81_008501 [Elliptochloris bilobata]|uniref:Metallo-beta-lactamase domain-containing protein n=1 Tax=Elliptochloris bilobata TaxID=381761 RepID=A0AAW1RRQ8_9CHLO